MSNIDTIVDYFKNILNIPDYYIIKSDYNPDSFGIFDLYAHIDDIKIYITDVNFSNQLLKSDIKINNHIMISDGLLQYRLLLPLDDFILLVIDDIIKSFGGIIL